MKKILLVLMAVCIGFAVNAQPPKVPADAGASFGQKTTSENAITVEQLNKKMKGKTGAVDVKLKGKVTEVCQEMGCWIKVQSTNGDMTVRMKGHSFFVPVILHGKSIIIDGIAEERVSTVEQQRHLAEDAGKSRAEIAKIKEPKKEIVIQAKGILVL